ncbi:MAG: hypothetical protein H7Y11_12610, partial [Armatimonadetes bacterium]|nr:hypothetical protein [Anaerolineae bacterium]
MQALPPDPLPTPDPLPITEPLPAPESPPTPDLTDKPAPPTPPTPPDQHPNPTPVTAAEKNPLRNFLIQLRGVLRGIIGRDFLVGVAALLELLVRSIRGAPPPWFIQVTPQLWVSGQYAGHGWSHLKRRGVTAVVNMRDEYDDQQTGVVP